jgi:hypothetical protein
MRTRQIDIPGPAARRLALALGAASGLALAVHGVGAQSAEDQPYDWIAADVTLQRALAGDAHEIAAPKVTYRVTHQRHGGGWKTVLEIHDRERPIIQTEDGPERLRDRSKVARVEDDGDGRPPRFYDHAGALIRSGRLSDQSVLGPPRNVKLPPAPQALTTGAGRSADPGGFQPLLLSRTDTPRRRDALVKNLGPPVERLRGRDRYIRRRGDTVEEVLTDPEWAVPVELSVLRRGTRVAHTTVDYQQGPGGALVSRTIRSERALQGARAGRAVTTVTFSNVRAESAR